MDRCTNRRSHLLCRQKEHDLWRSTNWSSAAREHNLKDIDLEIPVTNSWSLPGLSGSGKSSLAFDTIYAEGPATLRRVPLGLRASFCGLMEKPDVDQIEGLSPAISIDQKRRRAATRAPTVGTVTEVYDYLRLLFRPGRPAPLPHLRRADYAADAPSRSWTPSWT